MAVNDTEQTMKKDTNKRPIKVFAFDKIILTNTIAAPSNPVDGTIVYTDGVSWNPSGGQGVYAFYNNTWNKL